MITIQGKGVFGAIAIGKILFISRNDAEIRRERAEAPDAERLRFEDAKRAVEKQLDALYQKALKEVGEANAEIFEIHKMMLNDEDYNDSVIGIIEKQQVNAEYAVSLTSDNFAEMFSSIDDEYMKARAVDVKDISNRIIDFLLGRSGIGSGDGRYIICADELAPSETVALDKEKVLAFVTRLGSVNSHTSILARSMNIPAIIGAKSISKYLNGKTAAVDGFTGMIYVDPDEETLRLLKEKQENEAKKQKLLQELRGKESISADGKRISIFANISSPNDIGAVLSNDAEGIGLFRSEFLYLESKSLPDELTQLSSYKRVLEGMTGKRVIIRTMDIGADKQIGYLGLEKEDNPALGYRAVRICLDRPEIFKTQLRALLRASAYGNLSVMFPMITSLSEIREIKGILNEVYSELDSEKTEYCHSIEYGIMIETPAAAIMSDLIAPEVDFFSVGTNDLIQYTLAMDRQNPRLERFCNSHHEAVMRLIEYSAECAHRHGKWIGICGELAADTDLTEHWLKIGIDELSVSPPYVLPLRDKIRKINLNG